MRVFLSCITCMCLSFIFGIIFVHAATSNITKVIFTTGERGVDPGVLSEAITIQTQNESSEEEKLDSTADVTFTSSSDTGEFLGSTGKPVTKTMNSGSANKTFYYQDSTVGTHTITVEVIPRTGQGGWKAEQQIYIGTEAPRQDDGGEETESETTDDADDGVHSSQSKNAATSKKTNVKISAGRTRTVLPHSPIHFEAEITVSGKGSIPSMEYEWTFGDGDGEIGKRVEHMYYFPGEYNVVLEARHGSEILVSRTKVKVVDKAVTVASTSPGTYGFIELKNSNASEVNINGWKIRSGDWEYVISGDTIINAKSSVRIPNKVMHAEPVEKVELIFPTKEIAYVYNVRDKVPNVNEHIAQATIIEPAPSVMPEVVVEEKRNYATTVQAAAAIPKRGLWSYLMSFFSVE